MKIPWVARLPFLYYYVALAILRFVAWIPGYYKRPCKNRDRSPRLGIEAGPQGWQSIEFKELYQSACEYFGENAVARLVLDRSRPYPPQIRDFIINNGITHYLYDPRAARPESEQNYWTAFVDSLSVAFILARYRVVPIVFLTDLSLRLWRCQAAIVSSISGVVVTFMMPRLIQPIFPHRRLVGPSLMPFSIQTLYYLQGLKAELERTNQVDNLVRFTGSLYEPRTTFLKDFKDVLGERADIRGRELGTKRQTDEVYWTWIASANIVITTAFQFNQQGADMRHIPNMVYRYLEVLATGSLLLAPAIPGIERYFLPDKEFVAFCDLEDACSKAIYYLEHEVEAKSIALAGHDKAMKLIGCHTFWMQIDASLGSMGMFR